MLIIILQVEDLSRHQEHIRQHRLELMRMEQGWNSSWNELNEDYRIALAQIPNAFDNIGQTLRRTQGIVSHKILLKKTRFKL